MVVEDDARLAALLHKGLTRAGHVVDVAATGESGLEMMASGHYDMVVLDVRLPDTDGFSLCRTLRREFRLEIPILMLTARDSVDDKVQGLTAGADDYLTKPFSFDELKARILALSRRAPHVAGLEPIVIRDVVLDPGGMTVTRAGEPVLLSPKEFAVLELLMRHPGQVFSRDQLMDRLWSTDFDPTANVVDAVVARLRAKLEKSPSSPGLIKTVRGHGYKIDR